MLLLGEMGTYFRSFPNSGMRSMCIHGINILCHRMKVKEDAPIGPPGGYLTKASYLDIFAFDHWSYKGSFSKKLRMIEEGLFIAGFLRFQQINDIIKKWNKERLPAAAIKKRQSITARIIGIFQQNRKSKNVSRAGIKQIGNTYRVSLSFSFIHIQS